VLGRLYEGNDPGGAWLPYPKHRELTMSNERVLNCSFSITGSPVRASDVAAFHVAADG
jgi:hypothetical protein